MDKSEETRKIFGFTRGDSNPDMPPLSPAQDRNLTAVLAALDGADGCYDTKDTRQFATSFGQARRLHEESADLFPPRDLRLNLLSATVKAYQDVGLMLLGKDMQQFSETPDVTMLGGRVRKALLRRLMAGKLEADERSLLNYLLGK